MYLEGHTCPLSNHLFLSSHSDSDYQMQMLSATTTPDLHCSKPQCEKTKRGGMQSGHVASENMAHQPKSQLAGIWASTAGFPVFCLVAFQCF